MPRTKENNGLEQILRDLSYVDSAGVVIETASSSELRSKDALSLLPNYVNQAYQYLVKDMPEDYKAGIERLVNQFNNVSDPVQKLDIGKTLISQSQIKIYSESLRSVNKYLSNTSFDEKLLRLIGSEEVKKDIKDQEFLELFSNYSLWKSISEEPRIVYQNEKLQENILNESKVRFYNEGINNIFKEGSIETRKNLSMLYAKVASDYIVKNPNKIKEYATGIAKLMESRLKEKYKEGINNKLYKEIAGVLKRYLSSGNAKMEREALNLFYAAHTGAPLGSRNYSDWFDQKK